MFKRVLYTSYVDVSLPYGPGVNEYGFLKDMSQRFGSNLHVVIPRPARELPPELTSLDATYLTMFGSSRNPTAWFQARTTGAIALWSAIRKFNPDVIVLRSGAMSLSQLLIGAQKKVPYVIKTAGDGSHTEFYSRRKFSRALKPVDQLIQKCVFENACCIDVVSGPQKNKLSSLYPSLSERVHVIDNGVETAKFNPDNYPQSKKSLGFSDDDIVVGYVGSVPMQRGGKEVIDVVAALRSNTRVRGLIVGDSGEADACREYASKLGLSDLVVVYGEADYPKVPGLMAAIDCGMSIRRVNERSVAELKVRQYLASGACVVGTPVSNDFLRGYDFARVVESDETEEVVAAVQDLIENGQVRLAELGKKARAFADAELSLAARNDLRLRYWTEAIGNQHR